MKRFGKLSLSFLLLALLLSGALFAQQPREEFCHGIEMNGVICGYSDYTLSTIEQDGRELTVLEEDIFMMLSALGMEFNQRVELTYHIDPLTGQFTYHTGRLVQGDVDMSLAVRIEAGQARFTFSTGDEEMNVELPDGVILENTLFFPHLKRDFIDGEAVEKTYDILEPREQEIQQSTYTRAEAVEITLAGKQYEALIVERLNRATGTKIRYWLDVSNGRLLKLTSPRGRVSYLADPAVKKQIELADLDASIVSKVDVAIGDIHSISYMKVRAVLEPTGLWVATDDLSVPGQRFQGSVEENRIEGVFEIRHERYDGSDAPPFPATLPDDEALAEFLGPQDRMEADDPVLVAKAQELTKGSEDTWDAARRITRWVADNIDYEIPGGGSARKTYDIRAGECGAHSLLVAAFCRSVNIPARVVWGCMYVPNYGGAFCQHAWNEVYMGSAGWIPLDSTAHEIDFVDSGHLRVGILQSLSTAVNVRSIEVLEHELLESETPSGAADRFEPYIGEYTGPGGKVFKVHVQGDALAVDIPDQITLTFGDPDEDGKWPCKLTSQVYCFFELDETGRAAVMSMHQVVRMRRRSEPEKVEDSVPTDLRPLLGGYHFAAINAEFTVVYDEESLAIVDPIKKVTVHLDPPDENGWRLDEYGKNSVSFEMNEEGTPLAMILDSNNRMQRR